AKSPDLEIAERAKRLLSQFDARSVRTSNDSDINEVLKQMLNETEVSAKIWHVQYLGNFRELRNAEGLSSLCRFLRFSREPSIRAESAKVIIALSPSTPTLRRRWFQAVKKINGKAQNDVVQCLVADYITAFEIADRIQKRIEDGEADSANTTDKVALLEAAKRFAGTLNEFRGVPENVDYMKGSMTDILLYYALAELYDTASATAETEQAVADALALRGEKPAAANPYMLFDLHQISAWAAFHSQASFVIAERGRLLWAEQELQQIIEEHKLLKLSDEIEHKINSQESAAKWREVMMEENKTETGKAVNAFPDAKKFIPFILAGYADICSERDQFDESAMLLELAIPFVENMSRNGIPLTFNRATLHARLGCYKSKAAAARGDWKAAKETVDAALNASRNDSDLLIMRWQVEKNIPDLPNDYKLKTIAMINEALGNIRQSFNQGTSDDESIATRYNEYAWLSSSTNREPELATHYIANALKIQPENWAYLDTFSYVLASKGEIKKAIENQKKLTLRYPERTVLQTGLKRFEGM
ncbi:MAG: hypothetical protein LBU65_08320, partial [Planctomycetaceae bacterium]|nr:hypothetical protein [Planctomycetaceae bacterium]